MSILLSKLVQSICDASLNELNIHMIDSREFRSDGLYEEIHSLVVESTKEYYKSLQDFDISLLFQKLDKDLKLMQKYFLRKTCFEIEKHIVDLKIVKIQRNWVEDYKNFSNHKVKHIPEKSNSTEMLEILLNIDNDELKVSGFIDFLLLNEPESMHEFLFLVNFI